MRKLLFILLACLPALANAQDKDKQEILSVLSNQSQAWNNGDIPGFMQGYWNSDSLKFIGKSGITYGYKETLANYRKNYWNRDLMGKLIFTIVEVKRLSDKNYFVIGKWKLQRAKDDDVDGYFTLLFEKIDGKWVIVADHSS